MSFNKVTLEICCESPEEVRIASQYNIDRIELSSHLHDYGMTPTLGALKQSLEITDIPIVCSIRPRTGGFVYNPEEFGLMMLDAEILLENGAAGIVFGCLDENGHIQLEQTKQLAELAHKYQAEAIFHRAFDCVKEPIEALQQLSELGIDRIITAGCQPTAKEGIDMLKTLVEKKLVSILGAGGITKENVLEIIEKTGIREVHTSARMAVQDPGSHKLVQTAISKPEYKGKLLKINNQTIKGLTDCLK